METLKEVRERHAIELTELKAKHREEHYNAKMINLGVDYGMSEKTVMAHVAGNMEIEPVTIKSMEEAFKSIQEQMNKHVHQSFGISPEILNADEIYRKSLLDQGIDNDNKHYGTQTGRFSSGLHHIQSMPRMERHIKVVQPLEYIMVNVSLDDDGLQVSKAPKCECGAHKVQGPNCSARMHSTWCPLHGDV